MGSRMADNRPLSDNEAHDRLKAARNALGEAPGVTVAADTGRQSPPAAQAAQVPTAVRAATRGPVPNRRAVAVRSPVSRAQGGRDLGSALVARLSVLGVGPASDLSPIPAVFE